MTKKNPYERPKLRVVAIATAILLIAIAAILPFDALSPVIRSGNGPWDVLNRLLLIGLFIERGTEFLVELWRGSEKDDRKHSIELIKQRLKQTINDINEQQRLQEQLHVKSEELHQYQAITKRVALWTGFLFGLLISLAGVRALSWLLSIPDCECQKRLFRILDVILTAGLISGGSEALHQIMTFFKRFIEASERKATSRN